MSLIVGCAQCGKKYKVGDDKAGKKIKCQCGGIIAVPKAPAEDVDPWDEPASEAPAAPSRSRMPPPVVGRKSPGRPAPRKKATSGGGVPVGLIVGIVAGVVVLLGGGGVAAWYFLFRAKPDTPQVAQQGNSSQSAGSSQPDTGTPNNFPAVASTSSDFRKLIPDDAQIAVVFQPQKVLHSKLVTSLVPPKVLSDFVTNTKRDAPLNPESIVNVAVFYSPAPAGFPADKADSDPTAFFTGIIQFNDSGKMKDRLHKFLAAAPINVTSNLPGPAWWVSRKDFDRPDEKQTSKKRGYMRHTGEDGKSLMYEMNDDHKPTGKGYTDAELDAKYKQDREEFKKKKDREESAPNRRSSETPGPFDICLFAPDEQTLVVGLKVRVDVIAKGGGASAMKDVLKDADMAHDLILAGAKLDEFKPPMKAISQMPGGSQAALPLMMVTGAASQIKHLLLQIGISPGASLLDLRLTAKDDATAEQFQKQIEEGKQSGKKMALPLTASQPGSNTPGTQLLDEIDKTWKLTRTGTQLRLNIPHSQKLNDLTIAALQPAVNAAKMAAGKTEDRNRLKQLGLSIWNFHDSYSKFPPGGGDKDYRNPLPTEKQVGWLYDLLPFMEQANVHNQVQKDKPWDGPENRQAAVTVIPGYLNSEISMDMVQGYAPTHIVGIGGLGENGPKEPDGSKKAGVFAFSRRTRASNITDGSSNTIMAAQAYKNFGPWIANTNATIRPFTQKPYLHGPDGIGGPGNSGKTMVLMADGSVRTLSDNMDPSVIEALSTIGGGEQTPTLPSR